MDWLHQAQTARQNHARRSQTEPDEKVAGSVWLPGPKVCRKLEGSWPDCITYQTASELYFVYKKRQNLVLSGSIWPASFNFPSNFWSRKPDRTSNFLSGSVWHDFVWLSGPWCSQGIKQVKNRTVKSMETKSFSILCNLNSILTIN